MTQPSRPPMLARLLAEAARLLQAGQPEVAIPALREAARLQPRDPAILHDLGVACLQSGLLEEAIAALQGAVAAKPGFADAHLRLGIAWEAAGQVEAALAAYQVATAALPALADARYRAGNLLESLGRMDAAAAAFRRAAGATPRGAPGRIALARALLLEGQDAAAEKALRQALAQDRRNPAALELLGHLLADTGRFVAAREALMAAVDADPARAGLYYDIARCGRIQPNQAGLVARMAEAARQPELEAVQRSRVHLALGKAAADLRDFEPAMRHFDAAQALRDAVARVDIGAYEARVNRMIARFTPERLAREARLANREAGPAPILILGLPRSGTTLVEQILSAHPEVHAGGELPFWNARLRPWETAWIDMAQHSEAAVLEDTFLAQAGHDYAEHLRAIGGGARFVTDKMPMNIQWVGFIQLAMPRAIVIHCQRGAMDTALSIHQTHFSPWMDFPTGGAALVAYMRATARLAAHWRRAMPAGRFVEVAYEALVREPESGIRALLAACGLVWNAACLRPDLKVGAVRTPSKWQARQPINCESIDGWRAYEPWLGPLRALLQDAVNANTDSELTTLKNADE